LQGTSFYLREIQQNFFQIDEGIGRDKRQLCTEHAMAAGHTHHGNARGGRFHYHSRGRGRGVHGRRPQTASAHAAQQQSSVTCYRCGETGHIATGCPTNTSSGPSQTSSSRTAGQPGQRPRTAPPARGHAAAAQAGESTSTSNTSTSGTNPLRRTQDISRGTIIFLVHFYGGGLICKRLVYVECMSTVT
jgi:hypothetical protein